MSKKPRNERSEKAKTNSKWTSNEDYKSNYDRIFGPKVSPPTADKDCTICFGSGIDDRNSHLYGIGDCQCLKREQPK